MSLPSLLAGLLKTALFAVLRAAEAAVSLLHPLTPWGRRRLRTLRLAQRFPGPPGLPFLGNLLDLRPDPAVVLDDLVRLSRSYGSAYRMWAGPALVIIVSGPADVEALLTNPATSVDRGSPTKLIRLGLPHSILQMNGDEWWTRKRQLQPAFHAKVLDGFDPVFRRHCDTFLAKLAERADGREFDASPLVESLTFDVLCESAMGVNLDVQNNGDCEYFHTVMQAKYATVERSQKPWLYPDWAFRLSAVGRRAVGRLSVMRSIRDKARTVFLQIVAARTQELQQRAERRPEEAHRPAGETDSDGTVGAKRRPAFLDLLLQTPGLTAADVASEVDMLLIAGHDTTHCALSFALYLLSQNRGPQERLVRELESAFGAQSQRIEPTAEAVARLEYLDRVVRETLRLYPPNILLFREAREDAALAAGGLVAPKGAVILIVPYITVKNPDLFPDPDRFDPDRWLPENSRDRHPYAFFPFGAGPRSCSGKRFALNELKITLAKVLWAFQLLPAPGPAPRLGCAITGCPTGRVMLRVWPQQHPLPLGMD